MTYLLTNPKRGLHILTTLGQIMEDREFTIQEPYATERKALETDADRAREWYNREETLMTGKKGDKIIQVLCPKEDKLAIGTVRDYAEKYKDDKNQTIILVIQNITPPARQIVQACKRFEIFYEKELYCNVTHHVLYSPHRALSEPEEEAVLKRFKCIKHNLPILLRTEPIARYFGWSVGQMVEIKSSMGGTQEPFVTYRIVAEEK